MMSALLKFAVVAGSVIVSGAFATGAALADDLGSWRCDGGELKLKQVVSYNGTGCPPGSLDGNILVTDDLFSVVFDPEFYNAEQGSGIPGEDGRKNCAMRFLFEVPSGFQFSVADIQFMGFASLADGAWGKQEALFQFPLISPRTKVGITKRGPFEGGYTSEGTIPLPSYSRCGGEAILAINSQVYVGGKKREYSQMTVDTLDGEIKPIFSTTCHIRECGHHDR